MTDKVPPGKSPRGGPNSSRAWGRVVESADEYHERRARGVAAPAIPSSRNWHTVVQAKNGSGFNIRRGELLEFNNSPLTSPDNSSVWLNGVDVDLTHVGWGVALEPIAHNASSPEYGPVLVLGACVAHVLIKDESHKYAERVSGSRVLNSVAFGPVKILHKPAGGTPPEERECLVQLMCEVPPTGVKFRNDSGENIPPYAVMRVTGSVTVSGVEYVTVAKPNGDFKRRYLVNGSASVGTSGSAQYGVGTWLEEADWVQHESSFVPAVGETWGPVSGSWKLRKGRYGFTIVGNSTGSPNYYVRAWQSEVDLIYCQNGSSVVSVGGSGSFTVYHADGTSTGQTATVATPFFEVTANKKVTAGYYGDQWLVHSLHEKNFLWAKNGFTGTNVLSTVSTMNSGYCRLGTVTLGDGRQIGTVDGSTNSILTISSGWSGHKFLILWRACIWIDNSSPPDYSIRTLNLEQNSFAISAWQEQISMVANSHFAKPWDYQSFTGEGFVYATVSAGDTFRLRVHLNGETAEGQAFCELFFLPLFHG